MKEFSTAADLAAQTLNVGLRVRTTVHTVRNGGSEYVIVAGGTGTADNGAYIDIQNGNQAELVIIGGYLYPEQWGADGLGVADSLAALVAIDAFADNKDVTIKMTEKYAISAPWTIARRTSVESSRTAEMLGHGGNTTGLILASGNATGQKSLPTLVFSGVALDVRCHINQIYINEFNSCGVCVKFNCGVDNNSILDTVVNYNVMSNCTTAVEFHTEAAGNIIQGCGVNGNFQTTTINGAIFTGVGAFVDGNFYNVRAADFVTGGGALIDNQIAGFKVPRFDLDVTSWLGGIGFAAGSPTQLAKGGWEQCKLEMTGAQNFTNTQQVPNLVIGSNIKLQAMRALGQSYELVDQIVGLAGFNGGVMDGSDQFFVKETLVAELGPGQTIKRSFYHIFGDSQYLMYGVTPVSGASGITVSGVFDATSTDSGRIDISITNGGTSNYSIGTVLTFLVNRR